MHSLQLYSAVFSLTQTGDRKFATQVHWASISEQECLLEISVVKSVAQIVTVLLPLYAPRRHTHAHTVAFRRVALPRAITEQSQDRYTNTASSVFCMSPPPPPPSLWTQTDTRLTVYNAHVHSSHVSLMLSVLVTRLSRTTELPQTAVAGRQLIYCNFTSLDFKERHIDVTRFTGLLLISHKASLFYLLFSGVGRALYLCHVCLARRFVVVSCRHCLCVWPWLTGQSGAALQPIPLGPRSAACLATLTATVCPSESHPSRSPPPSFLSRLFQAFCSSFPLILPLPSVFCSFVSAPCLATLTGFFSFL